LLTPEFFKALKRDYDACIIPGQTGALDSDPWTGAQDGAVSEPFVLETVEYKNAEATGRLNYTFPNGPKNTHKQSVLLKRKREGPDSNWKLADFITPDQKSLIDLLASNP
jgi:hypothetical protein